MGWEEGCEGVARGSGMRAVGASKKKGSGGRCEPQQDVLYDDLRLIWVARGRRSMLYLCLECT